MKLRPFRAAVALTAALTTAVSPLLVNAQAAYEYKAYKQGLVVTGAATDPAPGPVTPPPPSPQPALQLSTTAINFGDVATNTTETRQVLVSNPGTGPLSFTAAPAVTGDAAFAAGLTTCGETLVAGADCLTDATFSPTTVGTYNGILKFTSVLAHSPHEVTLVGTAFNPVSLASTTLPRGMLGKSYSYDFKQLLNVSNEASPDKSQATWSGSGTLPTGLSFNTGTGVLAGTPTAKNSDASYTVTATYKGNQGQKVFTLTVGDAILEAVQISGGESHTCAVTVAHGVKCWGKNNFGQIGDGTKVDRYTPVDVVGLPAGVVSVSAGGSHTCAVTATGGVKCWGQNESGQLGNGTTTLALTPVVVANLSSVAAISAGVNHTCALTNSGAALCWGYGQSLGDGGWVNKAYPVNVVGLATDVTSLSAGFGHTCAVTLSGGAKCWGANAHGQLGDGTKTSRFVPVDVTGLTAGVTSIAAGENFTCATTSNGGAKCWGRNNYYQLGDGTMLDRSIPADVQGLAATAVSVDVGALHGCVLTVTGGVKCWGINSLAETGDGTQSARPTPVSVTGLTSGVTSIGAGNRHNCAVLSTGGAKCWGGGGYGAMGTGTGALALTPADVKP